MESVTKNRKPTSIELWSLAALVLLGTALRGYHLGHHSLWYDEAIFFHTVQGSWRDILAINVATNSSGPLYPLFLGLITGPDANEAVLRFPALVAGVVAIPLSYVLARRFTTPRFALLTPLLVSIAPTQIQYSQEVKEYALTFCIAICILLSFARFLSRQSAGRALVLGLTISIGMAIHHGIMVFVAALNLFCIFEFWRNKRPLSAFRLWFFAQFPGLATVAAVYVTTISGQLGPGNMVKLGFLADRYWDGTGTGIVSLLAGPGASIINFAFPGWIMATLVVCGAAYIVLRRATVAAGFLVAPVALTAIFALLGLYPYGGIRQDMYLLPMIYVCAAIGLEALSAGLARFARPHRITAVIWILVGLMALQGLRLSYQHLQSTGSESMRPIVAKLTEQLRPGERIYVHSSAIPAYEYYWAARAEPWTKGADHSPGYGPAERIAGQLKVVQNELDNLVEDPGTLWLVFSHLPESDIEKILTHLKPKADMELVISEPGSSLYRLQKANNFHSGR